MISLKAIQEMIRTEQAYRRTLVARRAALEIYGPVRPSASIHREIAAVEKKITGLRKEEKRISATVDAKGG